MKFNDALIRLLPRSRGGYSLMKLFRLKPWLICQQCPGYIQVLSNRYASLEDAQKHLPEVGYSISCVQELEAFKLEGCNFRVTKDALPL